MVAGRQLACTGHADAVVRLLGVLVRPDRLAIEHHKAPTGEPAPLRDDDARPRLRGTLSFGCDRVGRVLDSRRCALGDSHGALPIDKMLAPAREARPLEDGFYRRLRAEVQGQCVVASSLRPPQLLHCLELRRLRLGKVMALGEIFRQVVKLPVEALGGDSFGLRLPGEDERRSRGHPAVVIDAAIAEHLEQLRRSP